MKKILSLAFGTMLFASCSKTFIQIVDVNGSIPVENNKFVYSDNAVRITYSMWDNGGDSGFIIENVSDKTVYVDLTNSFFILNGAAHDYFLNRTHGRGSASTYTAMKSASADTFDFWSLSKLPKKIAYTATASATRTSTSSLSFSEKPIVAIPPHSYKSISEYSIASDVIEDCSVKLFPKKKSPESLTFTELNTPIKFTNYITYSVGEDSKPIVITNDFYVAGYTNYNIREIDEKVKVGCKEQAKVEYNTKAAGTRYYVKYTEKHSNRYSADCKMESYTANKRAKQH